MVLASKTTLLVKAFGLAIALIAIVITTSPVWADDDEKATKSEVAQDEPDEPKEVDPFEVPEGKPEELVDYIKKVLNMRPESQDMASALTFLKKSQNAVIKASDKILASSKATEQQCRLAVMAKFRGLLTLIQIKDLDAKKILKAFPKQLEKLRRPRLAKMVKGQLLQIELSQAASKAPDTRPLNEIVADIKKFIGNRPNAASVGIIMRTTSTLGRIDKKETVRFGNKYAKLLAASNNPFLVARAKTLKGIVRRLDLVGKSMKIVGKTLDGSEFNWASYKDKVVLVQFWATWCGPCRKEIPSILEDYEKYHKKGFDVVAISLDHGLEPLKEFVADDPLPWTIIYNGPRAEDEDEDLPNVTYYGVMGIPELILVGRDGKVIATGLRGKKLTAELENLFDSSEEK